MAFPQTSGRRSLLCPSERSKCTWEGMWIHSSLWWFHTFMKFRVHRIGSYHWNSYRKAEINNRIVIYFHLVPASWMEIFKQQHKHKELKVMDFASSGVVCRKGTGSFELLLTVLRSGPAMPPRCSNVPKCSLLQQPSLSWKWRPAVQRLLLH